MSLPDNQYVNVFPHPITPPLHTSHTSEEQRACLLPAQASAPIIIIVVIISISILLLLLASFACYYYSYYSSRYYIQSSLSDAFSMLWQHCRTYGHENTAILRETKRKWERGCKREDSMSTECNYGQQKWNRFFICRTRHNYSIVLNLMKLHP